MGQLYTIYFAGDVNEGEDPAAVRAALGRLFRADDATLDRLFSGTPQPIKRNCDKATALKYKQAMEKAGARPLVKAEQAAATPVAQEPPAPERPLSAAEKIAALAAAPDQGNFATEGEGEPAATVEQPGDDPFDLAAPGADVLSPDERSAPVTANVDTEHLQLDTAATRLSDEPPPPPPSPDTSHLSMGEVGDDIPTLDSGIEPLSPDTDALSLSPEGTDFADCAPADPEPPALDLSGIDLAPEGSDVLEEEYRRKDEAKAPDTQHITLED